MLKKALWRGVASAAAAVVAVSGFTAGIVEQYKSLIDVNLGTQNSIIVTDDDGTLYSTFVPDEKYLIRDDEGNIVGGNSEAVVAAHKELGAQVAEEGSVLLKNENNCLPVKGNRTVTLLGMRSYEMQGQVSQAQGYKKQQDVKLSDALVEQGVSVNETMLSVYKTLADQGWHTVNGIPKDEKYEPSLSVIDGTGIDYKSSFASSDTAIVVVGRGAGEGYKFDPSTHPLSLTATERELIELAKSDFDHVVVMLNTAAVMEIADLKADPKIDAIMWVGLPGNFGSIGIAKLIAGVSPSGGLADIYAADAMSSPAMVNFAINKYANASEIKAAPTTPIPATVTDYIIEDENIYVGYKYYETRYYDSIVNPSSGADSAVGAFASSGNWKYSDEVAYGFGYGLSYTEFEETLGKPKVVHEGHTFTLEFPVTVTNKGDTDSKRAIQIYVQAPYTDANKINGVEKAAVSLVAFEKTPMIKAGGTYNTTVKVDMQNVSSWDETALDGQGSYILDAGDYYFALGSGAHDALNNMLAKQNKTVANGMDYNGKAAACSVYNYDANGESADVYTFNISKSGKQVKNELQTGDWNKYDGSTKIKYLSRKDWANTWPVEHTDMTATPDMIANLYGDTYELKTNDDVSGVKFGKDNGLTISDMVGASFDDPRWEQLMDQLTIEDAINGSRKGGNDFNNLPSIGFATGGVNLSSDGPGGFYNTLGSTCTPSAPWTIKEGDPNYDFALSSYTNGVVLASAFNPDLVYAEGELTGIDGIFVGLPIFWGVGANVHRTPFGGRDAEYFSEDAVLTGICAMEFAIGAKTKGLIACGKHIAFYDNNMSHGTCVFMNEQRARENELRAFQIPIEASKYDEIMGEDVGMMGVMTSFPKFGTVEMTCNPYVLQNIMRGEWGFNGYAVSDGLDDNGYCKTAWTSGLTCFIIYWPSAVGDESAPNAPFPTATVENYQNDATLLAALKENVKRNMWVFANSNYMNSFNKTSRAVWQMTWYRATYISVLVISGAILLGSVAMYTVAAIKNKKENENEG